MTKFQELKSRLRSEYPDQKDALDAAAAIEELEEALTPFAKLNDCATGDKWRDHETQWINNVYETDYAPTIKQLRRARAALGETK